MNEPEIRRLVMPLLERNPDLVYFDRGLFVTPVRHHLRTVLFHRLGEKANVNVSVEVAPSFSGSKRVGKGFTTRRWPNSGLWWPECEGYPEKMLEMVESDCLPVLRTLHSFADYVALEAEYYEHGFAGAYLHRAVIALAQGRFGDAGAIFAKWDFARQFDWRVGGYGSRLAREGDDLPAEDKREIIRILHRNEAEAMRAMKLEKHWIPTPFPAEEQGLV